MTEIERRIRDESERRLSAVEVEAYLAVPVTDVEREDVGGLVAWFTRRYPTAGERLAYVRRAHRRWRG